jgi:DNA (cytosine-5)-methyltransferase 1
VKPIAFKVRGGGNYSGTKGGAVKPNEKGGAGYLGYEDKTFTIATAPDQWILAPITQPISNPMNEPAQPTPVGKPIRYLSVCSGMEAASVAWHPLGWTPVGFSEIEPFPCAILKHRFPNIPNYGSLTEYKQWPLEPGAIDLLVGGTPCQSFSVAGLRKGLDDPRGNLALVFLGLADKLKPRWIVWENVPGVLSSNGGRDLGSFLGALVQLGYGFAMRVLDAQYFGVPQRRRRVFVVACLGDWRAPAEVLLESDCVRRDPKKGRAKGQAVAAGSEGGVECATGQRTHALTASQKGATEDGTGRGTPIVIDRAAFNQGQNAQYEPHIAESEVMDSLVARGPHAVGQPIPFRKSKRACSTTDNETWVEADASNTLNNFDLGDTRTTHAVVAHCSDVAPTVTSSGPPYSRTGNERVDAEALAVTVNIYGGNKRKDRPEGGLYVREEDTSKCLDAANGLNPTCSQGGTAVVAPMAVRRLTPVECERLQGFPDNWSRISWKGKPEDQCPDGPRYKACGNSMAVPVMRWIGERIAAADAKHFPHA